MDRLLRGKEQAEMMEEIDKINEEFSHSFDFSNDIVFFPVRHHSPACSYHILKVIEEYSPEAILVEGPKNAEHLIPFAVSSETKAPFCIYLSYHDKSGKISEDKEKYRAYYPFLDYSPELVALRAGAEKGIHTEFIDLSYGDKLLNTPSRASEEEYDADREFIQSSYYKTLTEKMGCKNFNELWEMLFEINGSHIDTKSFVRNLFFYCYFSRKNTDEEELIVQGDIAREQYMAENILNAKKKYKKILVITGGIHTISLCKTISEDAESNVELKKDALENSSSYLMPYSFEESDRQSGYESGMVFPYYYQKVWLNIEKNRKKPFEEAALKFIILTAGELRKKHPISVADEMQSYYMAKGLAVLRQKKECGVFELIDSVKSSFVKGEINTTQQPALKTLYRIITGMEMGSVDTHAGVPPVVNDFLDKCKIYKIQTNSSLKKETKLDVYNNKLHMEKSNFFHQMDFLNTGFCSYRKGQDQNTGVGRILLRESWEYRFAPGVTVALISSSAYGGTLIEVCLSQLQKAIVSEHINARELSEKLVKASKMGLSSIYGDMFEKLTGLIGNDMDFLSVLGCFENLSSVKNHNNDFGEEKIPSLEGVMELTLNRLLTLCYTVVGVKKEDENNVCKGIKFIYQYFVQQEASQQEKNFLQALDSIRTDNDANAALCGASSAVLLKKEIISLEEVTESFQCYLNGTDGAKKMAAAYLKGFFMIAKDVLFVDKSLLSSIDTILSQSKGDLFLELLPDLRLAFTYFMPFETDKIAEIVAGFYGVKPTSLLYDKAYQQNDMELGGEIDKYINEKIEEWI